MKKTLLLFGFAVFLAWNVSAQQAHKNAITIGNSGFIGAAICYERALNSNFSLTAETTMYFSLFDLVDVVAINASLRARWYPLSDSDGRIVGFFFTGGLGVVFGPTGGFILSFPFLALAAGLGAEKNKKLYLWGGIVFGVLVNYICGVVYFSIFTSNDLITSFIVCVLVFIPGDILKIISVGLLGEKIRKMILQKNSQASG